jgi:hypothetical protein
MENHCAEKRDSGHGKVHRKSKQMENDDHKKGDKWKTIARNNKNPNMEWPTTKRDKWITITRKKRPSGKRLRGTT